MGVGHAWLVALLLLLIVFILVGPGKLSELGGALGRAIRDFRKTQEHARTAGSDEKKAPPEG